MNLAANKLEQLDNPTLPPDQRALIRCQAAAEFIHAGQYEAARDALRDLWCGIGQRPNLAGLQRTTRAEVLLQCGVLSGWLGSARNMSSAQELAKDLLSEAQQMFESLEQPIKVAEAQYELGMCYWRLGAFDEARVVMKEALHRLGERDVELKAKILIRRTVVEIWVCRYHDAWEILKEAEPVFKTANDALRGRWHGQMGLVLRQLGVAEDRIDYLDRAIIEYTAAIYHYEQANHERYCATNLNNLAMLLYRLKRYVEAHEHLDRAHTIFSRLKDPGNLAQVDETRARVLLAENRYTEAATVIASAVRVFENGGENALLADALSVQGTVSARLGNYNRSVDLLRYAIKVATNAGALESAGQAALSLLEEHGRTRLTQAEIYEAYHRADEFLKNSQDLEDIKRLRACASIVTRRLLGMQLTDPNFSLPAAVHAYEARFVEEALERAEGSVTRAANLLGFKHHGSLAVILKTRHKQLLAKRIPAIPRRRSIIARNTSSKRQPMP